MLRPSSTLASDVSAHRAPYTSGEFSGPQGEDRRMALLELSHTPLEDQLYRAMLSEVVRAKRSSAAFSVRGLAELSGINSLSSIRRTLSGLLRKLSIQKTEGEGAAKRQAGDTYRIYMPEEIFERRQAAGLLPYPKEVERYERSAAFNQAIERVLRRSNLSRREAHVALACAEGLTNIEIGRRLSIGEQTVKFHLRNIFVKFGVRRRTELISRLLIQDGRPGAVEESRGRRMV